MVNGGIPEQLTNFFTSVAGQATSNLLQRKQQEAQRVSELATGLASSGQLAGLPPEIQKSFQKTLGNEVFEALQFQSGLSQQRQAPIEALRRGAVETLQAPVAEQIGIEEGPQPVTEEGLPAAGPGEAQPIFGERPPTDVEQFERLQELPPTGAALIGGPQLGQLSAQQATILAGQLGRNAAERREVNSLVKTAISNNRRILQPIPLAAFDPDNVPEGFVPITAGDSVVLIGAKEPNFKNVSDNLLRIRALPDAPDDPRDVSETQARAVLEGKLRDQVAVSAAQGAQAAKLAKSTFLSNPLVQNSLEGFFDKATGEMIPGGSITGPVLEAERKGQVVKLRGTERDQLTELRKGASTINQIVSHVKALYGPGGVLENLQASGRIPRGIKAGLGRFFQTEPELAVAKRSLDTQVINLARQLRGAKGPLSDRDVATMQGIIVKLGAIPDTKEVAFGLLRDLQNSANGAAGAILRNPGFTLGGLVPFEEAQPQVIPVEEATETASELTPQQVSNLLADESPQIARIVSGMFENNPNMTLEQGQRMVRTLRLPPELMDAVARGQIALEAAEAQVQGQ